MKENKNLLSNLSSSSKFLFQVLPFIAWISVGGTNYPPHTDLHKIVIHLPFRLQGLHIARPLHVRAGQHGDLAHPLEGAVPVHKVGAEAGSQNRVGFQGREAGLQAGRQLVRVAGQLSLGRWLQFILDGRNFL